MLYINNYVQNQVQPLSYKLLRKESTQIQSGESTGSASIDVDVNSQDENGIESEKDESVHSYGLAIRLHAPKLHLPAVSR